MLIERFIIIFKLLAMLIFSDLLFVDSSLLFNQTYNVFFYFLDQHEALEQSYTWKFVFNFCPIFFSFLGTNKKDLK